MLPDEKALVKRLQDKPFVLLGINSDMPPGDEELEKKSFGEKLDPVRKYVKSEILEKNGITWRNAIECGTDGPWSSKWNVQGWPTLYVIDATGKIRYKGHSGEKMEDMVLELLDLPHELDELPVDDK